MKRPNVLILYTDQQRWDTIRAAGNTRIHTPNLDRLAERGALFENAFVNCPVCMPSRMSMLSGRYPASLRIAVNGIEMPENVPCVHNVLKSYDYHTANIGKLHFKNHASMFRDHREPHPRYGFDTLILSDEPGCYDDAYIKWVSEKEPDAVPSCRINTPPAWTGEPVKVHPRKAVSPYIFQGSEHLTHTSFVARETIEYISRHKADQFFCVAGFYAPHAPINPPERFTDMYKLDDMPLPNRNEGENVGNTSEEEWRKIKAYYYALISHIDEEVGKILHTLHDLDLEEDTIVIFTSDHGEHLGDHGLIGKSQAYDSSSHVPFLVSYPRKIKPGQRQKEVVEAVDIVPSILDWCGVQVPPFMQGSSLRPLLEPGRNGYRKRSSAFIEHRKPFMEAYKAVRTDEYLYVIHDDGEEELYDLSLDPHQLTDIAGKPETQNVLADMRKELMDRWFEVEGQYPKRTGYY